MYVHTYVCMIGSEVFETRLTWATQPISPLIKKTLFSLHFIFIIYEMGQIHMLMNYGA